MTVRKADSGGRLWVEGLAQSLNFLQQDGMRRILPQVQAAGSYVVADGRRMLNLSANDYLALAADEALRRRFLDGLSLRQACFSASSSRLLGGSFAVFDRLESLLAAYYGSEACLLFNSGYHANCGILPALADRHTLIVADKLVHASLIDGMRLAHQQHGAAFCRFAHRDYAHLARILERRGRQFERVIVVTESVFSMDGDCADLRRLAALKQQFGRVLLYVDEAHAFGVCGPDGLGLAQEQECIGAIDLLVGTFGKALAAAGAFVVCAAAVKEWLVNRARSLLYSTALPPIVAEWVYFLLARLPQWTARRQHLQAMALRLQTALAGLPGVTGQAESHIVPYMLGSAAQAQDCARYLQQAGFYCLPVRPPTVPPGRARVRFSLHAGLSADDVDALAAAVEAYADAL